MGNTAAIYTRISLDHADGAGVARQEDDCRALAQREGLTVTEVYCDNSISAYSGAERPAFEQLLADVRTVDNVIVYATDRLYRQPKDLERLVDLLGDTPVLAVKSGRISLDTADGRMYARMLGTVAAHSSEKTAERVAAAARGRATKGRSTTSSRPFGWKWKNPCPGGDECEHETPNPGPCRRTRVGARSGLEVDPIEGPVVATAYRMLIDGHSLAAIGRWIESEGFQGSKGGAFNQARVSEILRLPRHGGMVTYHGKTVTDTANTEGSLVDAETWHQAMSILQQPERKKRGAGPKALITGRLARCYKCESSVRAGSRRKRSGGRYLTYACKPSQHVSWPRDDLDAIVTDTVIAYLTKNADALAQARDDAAASGSDRVAAAREDLTRLREKRDTLAREFAADVVSVDAFITASKALDESIAQAQVTVKPKVAPSVASLLDADHIAGAWHDTDIVGRRAVLAELIDHITVYPARTGRVEFTWRSA